MDFTFVLPVLIVLAALLTVHISWSKSLVQRWALQRSYILHRCRVCLFNSGPYTYFGGGIGQAVFKIDVSDKNGLYRSGYARVGGFAAGAWRHKVEVKWDSKLLDE